MPAYKSQHFLPKVYLGHFGRPPERKLEHRLVWRVSETQYGEVPVGTQCQKDYFYSKDRASICESYFGEFESVYGLLMGKIGRRESLDQKQLFLFFLCAVDFYARGCKFKVKDKAEEFARYLHRMDIFKRKLISPELETATDAKRREYILRHWQFAIIPFPETAVLTSDSPAIWLSSSKTVDQLLGVLMPLTPMGVFVGVHRGHDDLIRRAGTDADAGIITNEEIDNCVDAVYFSDPFEESEIATIRKRLAKRERLAPLANAWKFDMIEYDHGPHLSFIKPR
ncbi:MAG TPA: DUF4238 domain-containing protein [Lacunisphaera sp.]|nr:DUF4238 domain-containing protein [Lacunisphaera sp.]